MDTIVIANFEYYSCSVRKIQILGSLTYPCQQWALLGEFEANDTRAEQIFELRQPMWARYLKLRFLTHHGSQHYWSLTTVRAYGQTHVDKFNSDNKRLQDAVNAVAAAAEKEKEESGSEQQQGEEEGHEGDGESGHPDDEYQSKFKLLVATSRAGSAYVCSSIHSATTPRPRGPTRRRTRRRDRGRRGRTPRARERLAREVPCGARRQRDHHFKTADAHA